MGATGRLVLSHGSRFDGQHLSTLARSGGLNSTVTTTHFDRSATRSGISHWVPTAQLPQLSK
ncbi:MAG TPA: hypothetical protein DDY91_06740 [Planctomycetaceae bacterium]|nr:hypothetical protein [Planctomycetaceae bacterium]